MNKLKVGLDIDQVICEWWNPYVKRFGLPKKDSEITRNCSKIAKDRDFWINLPVINRPYGFTPELYCTKRSCVKNYTKSWLKANNFPDRPVYQVLCQASNKASYIKGRVDVFIDDSLSNFIAMNKSGVPCLLFDSDFNQDWGPIGRVYNLNYDHIEETYNLFMDTIFSNFRSLL